MNTLNADQWETLSARMLERALSGDAAAIRFCEKHKPAEAAGGGMASIAFIKRSDLEEIKRELDGMNADQIRAYIASRLSRLRAEGGTDLSHLSTEQLRALAGHDPDPRTMTSDERRAYIADLRARIAAAKAGDGLDGEKTE